MHPIRRANRPLLTIHIAASVAVFGAELVLLALGVSGARGTDPRQVYPAAHLAAQWLMAPLALVSLVTGLLLVATTGWHPLRHWWVGAKLGITTVLTILVFTVLIPGLAKTAELATTGEPITNAARTRFVLIPIAGAALLALNIALAVFKPSRPHHRARPLQASTADARSTA
jgi:hypothetical protein